MSQQSSSDVESGTSEYRTDQILTLLRRAPVPNTELIRVVEAVHDELVEVNAHLIDLIEAVNIHSEMFSEMFEMEGEE